MKKNFSFLWILCFCIPSLACFGPTNVSGVAFTNGEKINLNLAVFGTEGVNYKVEIKENGGTTVSYPSHYNSTAMAFIGDAGMSYQEKMRLECMGIVYPISSESETFNNKIKKEVFDFNAAIKAELEWLVANNILLIDNSAMDTIIANIANKLNGGAQYWTLQKKTLNYSSWYVYDTIMDSWNDMDINGVKNVQLTVQEPPCSGVDIPDYYSFTPSTVKMNNALSKNSSDNYLRVLDKTVKIEGLQANQHLSGTVVSITGKIMTSFWVSGKSQNTIDLSELAPGTYILKCNKQGQTLNKSVVIY